MAAPGLRHPGPSRLLLSAILGVLVICACLMLKDDKHEISLFSRSTLQGSSHERQRANSARMRSLPSRFVELQEGAVQQDDDSDISRQKNELAKQESKHMAEREAAMEKALHLMEIEARKGRVNAESQKWLKWKAAHEKYEQAAFENISSIENNKTGISPEGEAYFDKIGTLAQKYDGSLGYESLLNMSKELEENRTISWNHLLSVQKNRSTFFPLIDRGIEIHIGSPAQSNIRSSSGLSLADSRNLQSLPSSSSALKVGQKAVAIKSFLFSQGGMIPVKEGEAVTVLEVDDKMGVDKVLTGQGKVGWFPQTDLRGQTETKGPSFSRNTVESSRNSDVVASAIAEGNQRYAEAREREIAMSKEKRKTRAMIRSSSDSKMLDASASHGESDNEQVQPPSVVQNAIREANDRYRSAKKQEVERSLQLEKLRKKQRSLVKEIHEQEKLIDMAKQAREEADAQDDEEKGSPDAVKPASSLPAASAVKSTSSSSAASDEQDDDLTIVKSDDAVLAGLRKAQKSYVSAKVKEEEKSLLERIKRADARSSLSKEREVERKVRDQRMKISKEEDEDKHAAVNANLKRHVDAIGSAFKSEEDYFLQAHKKEIHNLAMERMRKASHMLALPRGGMTTERKGLTQSPMSKSLVTKSTSRWRKEQELELETRRAEEEAVRAADKMFNRHMKPLEHVERGYENYEHELER
mmetsp:Transcript_33091/g.104646  ORF Transcript_33091/g.104646 Transcript_33091/m.104646 type:complete len:697 (+) Transcript_33091:13-2103(+)